MLADERGGVIGEDLINSIVQVGIKLCDDGGWVYLTVIRVLGEIYELTEDPF